MTNEGQLPIMRNMLNSAMRVGIPMNLFHCYILTTDKEVADYETPRFNALTLKKLKVIQMNMQLDREVLWVDNDIVFLQNCINDVLSKNGNFVMQDDLWSPCTGFFLARSDHFSDSVIKRSITWLSNQTDRHINDQHAFNQAYRQVPRINLTLLPRNEYPNGHIYFERGTTAARMIHCNSLSTTAEKVERLKAHSLWDDSGAAYQIVNKYSLAL